MSEERIYSRQEFANRIKVSVSTLKRWERQKFLIAHRNFSGRPFYTDEHYRHYLAFASKKSNF